MRIFWILVLTLLSQSVSAQTHTNRGGSGPDGERISSCSQIATSAKELQLKYLRMDPTFLKKKIDKVDVDAEFVNLIQFQNLEIDMNLIGKLQMPLCENCLSEKKRILKDLVEAYESQSHCPEFWKKEDLIPLMKNIITYGK
jgi:hypothetical protein